MLAQPINDTGSPLVQGGLIIGPSIEVQVTSEPGPGKKGRLVAGSGWGSPSR